MGRTLPYECHHGTIIDYGDFGPHQNGCEDSCFTEGCPDHPTCEQCEEEVEAAQEQHEVAGYATLTRHVDEWCEELDVHVPYPDRKALVDRITADFVGRPTRVPTSAKGDELGPLPHPLCIEGGCDVEERQGGPKCALNECALGMWNACHYYDEDRHGPICGGGVEGDGMTFFPDNTTCHECLARFTTASSAKPIEEQP